MTVDDVRPQLDRLKKYPLLRGVRMQLHWHETPAFRFAKSADQVIDPTVKKNVARLRDYGLSFDLQLFPAQMKDGLELVGENPETDFILTHTGMLTDLAEPVVEEWKAGLRTLAKVPNLYAKLSGLGTFVHRNDPEVIGVVVDNAVEILGSDRLMFGSNFPIEKLWTSHAELIAAHRAAVAKHGAKAEADIFWNTAARVYRPA
jgi:predicted TIM-barrel fold metal-dependent hydrolase